MDLSAIDHQLFGSVSGHSISAKAKESCMSYSAFELTYGEVTPKAVEAFLSHVSPKEGQVFYDLGAGTGKAVFYAALQFPFRKCVGVELLAGLHAAAKDVLKTYDADIRPRLDEQKQNQEIGFIQGDMFDVDIADADIAFSHATCFGPDLLLRMKRKLGELKPGAHAIIANPLKIESDVLEEILVEPCDMGWGTATLRYYRRR